MITIEYCADGVAVNEFLVKEWALSVLHGLPEQYVKVSTSFPITYTRLLVARGAISHKDIVFVYDGIIIKMNEYAAILDWPKGFIMKDYDASVEIIQTGIRRRKYGNDSQKTKEITEQSP